MDSNRKPFHKARSRAKKYRIENPQPGLAPARATCSRPCPSQYRDLFLKRLPAGFLLQEPIFDQLLRDRNREFLRRLRKEEKYFPASGHDARCFWNGRPRALRQLLARFPASVPTEADRFE